MPWRTLPRGAAVALVFLVGLGIGICFVINSAMMREATRNADFEFEKRFVVGGWKTLTPSSFSLKNCVGPCVSRTTKCIEPARAAHLLHAESVAVAL